jgi:hypothetical protein
VNVRAIVKEAMKEARQASKGLALSSVFLPYYCGEEQKLLKPYLLRVHFAI